jgi:hypothetical protein
MQNIYAILAKYNLTIPEDKKTEFEEAVKANYKTVAEVEKITTARDNYKTQLETAQQTLEGFKGVDVNELNGKIEKLQNDLTAQENAHKKQLADIEFNGKVFDLAKKAGARNPKAVMPFLDLEALKASTNQEADIEAAMNACKEAEGYLFGADEPYGNPTHRTEGGGGNTGGPLASMRAAMGLPPEIK